MLDLNLRLDLHQLFLSAINGVKVLIAPIVHGPPASSKLQLASIQQSIVCSRHLGTVQMTAEAYHVPELDCSG